MKTVAFDGSMGASGDMLLGALLDVGANPAALEPIEAALGVTFQIDETVSQGIAATDVSVTYSDQAHDHHHHHAEGAGPHRAYTEVIDIVRGMELPPAVTAKVVAAFELLGQAEAAVHGAEIDTIQFHEVGADDAIADVTGVAVLLADLDIDRCLTGPLAVGGGEVDTSHGTYPIPPPAVVEIAARSSLTIHGGPVDEELLTPTGAAILGAMAESVDALPACSITATGYGCGDNTIPGRPNVVRAVVGTVTGQLGREDIRVLETNIDDISPEILGHLQDRLATEGALDVSIVPITMKKSRPGHLVKVIVSPADAERIARALVQETGTLGVRSSPVTHRYRVDRSIYPVELTVNGEQFEVDVKVAVDTSGTVIDRSVEFADAARVAAAVDKPVREIMRRAEAIADTQ